MTSMTLKGMLFGRVALTGAFCLALGGGACATGSSGAPKVDELTRTIDALRAQNAAYARQVEELQNRLFIAQDQLDSRKVASEKKAAPNLPVVSLSPYGNDDTYYPADDDVEYAGEAARTSTVRPVVKLEGSETPFLADKKPTVAVLPNPLRVGKETEAAGGAKRVDVKGEVASSAAAPLPTLKPAAGAGNKALPPAAAAARATADHHASAIASPAPVAIAAASPPKVAPAPAAAVVPAKLPPAPAPAPAPAPPPHTAGETAMAAAPDPEPLRVYREALDHLKAHRHAEAVAGFREFVKHNPGHDYADNAQYWLGECFYDLKDHRSAVREFRQVVTRFPNGNKVPDALLKAGYSYLALGEEAAGRQAFGEIVRAYPKHDAARLAELKVKELDNAATASRSPSSPKAPEGTAEVR